MAHSVEGLPQALKALRQISPDIYKRMNAEIRPALKSITHDAQGYLPKEIPGLSHWTHPSQEASSKGSRTRSFPTYQLTSAKRGIKYSTRPMRANKNGWQALFAIFNATASGAIIETAGRKNPYGSPKSRSNNPNAGLHFIQAIQAAVGGFYRVGSRQRDLGRVIYKAVNKDGGKARTAIITAINKAEQDFVRRANAWTPSR